jgi:hypothetical protein
LPATRLGGDPLRTYTATLYCDNVLTYEAPTLVPDVGEVVPCRRHGFCAVKSREMGGGHGGSAAGRAARRNSQTELVAFPREHPTTTIHELRRCRFPLRLLAAAQKEGLVDVDFVTGRVARRTSINVL